MKARLILPLAVLVALPVIGAGPGNGPMHGGHGNGPGNGCAMRNADGQASHHDTIHELMADHKAIKREIADIPKGVTTTTTSSDPAVVDKLRLHVRQMHERLTTGQPIRMMDPLFREIFAKADKITLKFEDVAGGIRVTETSDDPQVQLLIRQHARVVSEFTAQGMPRMPQPSALPEGYTATQDAKGGSGCGQGCCKRKGQA